MTESIDIIPLDSPVEEPEQSIEIKIDENQETSRKLLR